MEYVIYQSGLKPSKKKGTLPDVVYSYIANTSDIGWHFDYTNDLDKAHRFCDFEMNEIKEYCALLGMKYKAV